ncbi:MAG: exo-alpha-sialidase [Armatimonadetes bacterium]|nr:exo-alpha-sialidase [Armatimonadota bacterium]
MSLATLGVSLMLAGATCASADPGDLTVFRPASDTGPDAENQHFLVAATPKGSFLAFWTQASVENAPDQRVVMSRSLDRGQTWTPPAVLAGDREGKGHRAQWAFPFVVPYTGRVYVFYNQSTGGRDVREDTTGLLACRFSDDDGLSWSPSFTLPIRKSAVSNPEPESPENWIAYQPPIITSQGAVLVGFTRWASRAVQPEGEVFDRDSEIWFLRFGNLLTESDPARLIVTTLPEGEHGIRVPRPDRQTISAAQEPSLVHLSDGRLLTVFRTLTGMIYFSTSADGGRTWQLPAPLRSSPGGSPIRQPIAPCPLYKLRDGRFLLIFHNNDGTANGGNGPMDYKKNRRPAYLSVGRELSGRPDQPLLFAAPRLLCDNGGIPAGPIGRTEIATYPSLFEWEDRVCFFYPDRKHFLLGKILSPALLNDVGLPR